MTISMKELWESSHTSAGHSAYLESLYETYITDSSSLSNEWIEFFNNLPPFLTLHAEHAVTTLSQLVSPPFDLGNK